MLTDRHVHWSPNGQYLLSTHRQGVQLWGGPFFANLQKFEHRQVELINFSPNETFLITALTNEKIRMGSQQDQQLDAVESRSLTDFEFISYSLVSMHCLSINTVSLSLSQSVR